MLLKKWVIKPRRSSSSKSSRRRRRCWLHREEAGHRLRALQVPEVAQLLLV